MRYLLVLTFLLAACNQPDDSCGAVRESIDKMMMLMNKAEASREKYEAVTEAYVLSKSPPTPQQISNLYVFKVELDESVRELSAYVDSVRNVKCK